MNWAIIGGILAEAASRALPIIIESIRDEDWSGAFKNDAALKSEHIDRFLDILERWVENEKSR
jgi:hypothetical protein